MDNCQKCEKPIPVGKLTYQRGDYVLCMPCFWEARANGEMNPISSASIADEVAYFEQAWRERI